METDSDLWEKLFWKCRDENRSIWNRIEFENENFAFRVDENFRWKFEEFATEKFRDKLKRSPECSIDFESSNEVARAKNSNRNEKKSFPVRQKRCAKKENFAKNFSKF